MSEEQKTKEERQREKLSGKQWFLESKIQFEQIPDNWMTRNDMIAFMALTACNSEI